MKEEQPKRELAIGRIENGSVIDHVPAGRALTILKILGIADTYPETVSIAMNVPSKSYGKKDIVKVEKKKLTQKEIDRIALIAPNATINIIKDWKIADKKSTRLPGEIEGVIPCANPLCVTNSKEPAKTRFTLESKTPIRIRCAYCERTMYGEKIERFL